jgi:hypothetical protein
MKYVSGEKQARKRELRVFSCDYNGWADMPEAEREAIEALELGHLPAGQAPLREIPPPPAAPVRWIPEQRAA